MIHLNELIQEEIKRGYTAINATAKVCQDIVLTAFSTGPFSRNVTIKGGVVMRSKTKNVRRATQDLDIDFIRYTLSDTAIDIFINKLNCLEGLQIKRIGKIEEMIFENPVYRKKLMTTDKNWLPERLEDVLTGFLTFLQTLRE